MKDIYITTIISTEPTPEVVRHVATGGTKATVVRQQYTATTGGSDDIASNEAAALMQAAGAERFERLADQWESDTRNLSSTTQKAIHPAYQDIVAMGPKVVPMILRRMERQGGHWFWALHHLTGQNPVEKAAEGDVGRMTEAWLKWGRSRGYLTRTGSSKTSRR
jgi:hypothetical protein